VVVVSDRVAISNAVRSAVSLAALAALALAACGRPDAVSEAGSGDDPGPAFLRTEGWSVRARLRTSSAVLLLEEVLVGFAERSAPSRIRRLATRGGPERSWPAPAGLLIADAAWHPSGEVSAVLVGEDASVWLARLTPELAPIAMSMLHDLDLADDPLNSGAGETDLRAHVLFSLATAARVAADREDVVVAVDSPANELITYRLSWAGRWSPPRRTVIEPALGLTPLLPIGGSFDTFGAMDAWFRPLLDVDPDGNAYVATWVNRRRIQRHAAAFGEQLMPLSTDPDSALDSDILLTKVDRSGARAWSRVVGSGHEDEPYAIRAASDAIAVVGRARRNPGFDNTFWDALISVSSSQGDLLGTRVLQLEASSILLAVDRLGVAGWVVGGSEGWTQNPDGLSVLSSGSKVLLELATLDGDPVRLPVPTGARHNEIRSVFAAAGVVGFAGHEDGPVMHTGDADPTQIHSTGVVGHVPR
jgi:hypothetical protein